MMDSKNLAEELCRIAAQFRVQSQSGGTYGLRKLLETERQNDSLFSTLIERYGKAVGETIGSLIQAMERGDGLRIADLLEGVCIPALRCMEELPEEIEREDYVIEPTDSGFATLRYCGEGQDFLIHSGLDPVEEARVLVERYYDPTKENYAVWGCGLGYHVWMLWRKSEESVRIRVYEEDAEAIEIAREYGVYRGLPERDVELIRDPNGELFAALIQRQDTGILMYYPSIQKIRKGELKKIIHGFFVKWNGTIQIAPMLAINFRKNCISCKRNVDELREIIYGREVCIVGAGPSLDSNWDYLRESKGRKVILSVTTVLRRFLAEGILPDYTVVMDAEDGVYQQIVGLEKVTDVPMIVDSTAYWKVAANYASEKYLAYQRGYDAAERAAEGSGHGLYGTGGTVTSLALDVALKLGATAIYFIGVDLAYKEGRSHAAGTYDFHMEDTENLYPVSGVNGGIVYESVLFANFRKWIEREIRRYPQVKCYNLSDCGAHIEGTIEI